MHANIYMHNIRLLQAALAIMSCPSTTSNQKGVLPFLSGTTIDVPAAYGSSSDINSLLHKRQVFGANSCGCSPNLVVPDEAEELGLESEFDLFTRGIHSWLQYAPFRQLLIP